MSSGKHMIIDIKEIKNESLLNSPDEIKKLLDEICEKYNYTILSKTEHIFDPIGYTALYLLSESHISVHTFPEHKYISMDIYTCRTYENNDVYNEIYDYIIKSFDAHSEQPFIIDRVYSIKRMNSLTTVKENIKNYINYTKIFSNISANTLNNVFLKLIDNIINIISKISHT